MAKVTGIGGVFFRCKDPQATAAWYSEHLGLPAEAWGGSVLLWREHEQPDERGYTVWSPFDLDSEKFEPSTSELMLNLRVDDMDGILEQLRAAGAQQVGEVESHPNGRFAWVMDVDGRKLELWEPVPSAEDPYLP